MRDSNMTDGLCICCNKNPVVWPRVCDDCQDKEAQAEIAMDFWLGEDSCCRTCGMLYDGGMRCTYCGDADPLDDGDFDDDDGLRSDLDDFGYDDEPIGSCEQCGSNLYADDDEEYCDRCLWWMEQ